MTIVTLTIFLVVLVSSVGCEVQTVASMTKPIMTVMAKYSDLTKYQKNSLLNTPQFDDCYPSLAPHLYSGQISETEHGAACQKWVDKTPHQHTFDGWSFNDGYIPENYCRVDKGDTKRRGRPWCLTKSPGKEWDYCPVPVCHPNIGFCVTKMPGLDGFSSGIDLLEFDLYKIGAGRRAVVFEFTCYNNWKDVFEGDVYTQPDQIGFYMQKDKGSLNNNAVVIKTVSDLTKAMAASVSLSAGYGAVSGSLSSSYKQMERTIKSGNYVITRTEGTEITAEARLVKASELPLNADFKDDMNALPDTFLQNEQAYMDFIRKYGTHYITEALFGGLVRVQSVTESAFLKTHTEKDLSVAAGFQYDGLVSVSAEAEFSKGEKKLNEDFKKTSKTTSVYYGGDVNFSKDGITKWQQSVKTNPVMTNVKLNGIYELFTDNNKKKQMQTAVAHYVSIRLDCSDELQKQYCQCDDDTWKMERGQCYKMSTERKNWDEARSQCLSIGSQLVSVDDFRENEFVKEMCHIDEYSGLALTWLNLQNVGGTWVSADTLNRADWTRWHKGSYANVNHGNVDITKKVCAYMICSDGPGDESFWVPGRCDSKTRVKKRFICEKPATIKQD